MFNSINPVLYMLLLLCLFSTILPRLHGLTPGPGHGTTVTWMRLRDSRVLSVWARQFASDPRISVVHVHRSRDT